MKRQTLLTRFLLVFGLLFTVGLSACGAKIPVETAQIHFQPEISINLPDGVTLVGIGEATHGNAEFQHLRRDVLEQLVTRYGFRAFAIEGDFGGGQVVNRYVLGEPGAPASAEEAVREIGFAIYRTQEMADLVEWIRQYNASAAPDQRIHFYGFDMQRYDNNIEGLFAYFEQVDPALVETYREDLADLNDETVFDQQKEKIEAGLRAVQAIRAQLQQEKERYIAASSQQAFDLADQFANSIEQNATLRSGGGSYQEQRSKFMTDKVQWIVAYEQSQGRSGLLIAGHNGHIEKSAAAAMYRSMGSRLSESYGAQYFAIGTEFLESTFNSREGNGSERKLFTVKNNNDLNHAFASTGSETAYLDIRSALADDVMAPLLTAKQPMSNIGESFSSWQSLIKSFYTISMAPADAYDAIIFVRKATPFTLLEN